MNVMWADGEASEHVTLYVVLFFVQKQIINKQNQFLIDSRCF